MNTATNAKHTTEPWNLSDWDRTCIRDAQCENIAKVCSTSDYLQPDNIANAARIVSCVNLLAGVPQADLDLVLLRFPSDAGARRRYLSDILRALGG